MNHWKNLLVCLLAGVLALGVLTACSGLGSVNAGTDAEKAAELAQQLGVAHTQELDNTAKAVAEWFVQEPDSLRVSGLDLVYTVALDAAPSHWWKRAISLNWTWRPAALRSPV